MNILNWVWAFFAFLEVFIFQEFLYIKSFLFLKRKLLLHYKSWNWTPHSRRRTFEHIFEHLNKACAPLWSKRPLRRLLFTKVEHTKLKPFLAKIPRTDCLWCDKKILKMRPPKTISKTGSTAYKKTTKRASVSQSWSKSWLSIVGAM